MKNKRRKRHKSKKRHRPGRKTGPDSRGPLWRYLVLSLVSAGMAVALGWWLLQPLPLSGGPEVAPEQSLTAVPPPSELRILFPFEGSVFPRDIAPVRFFWEDTAEGVNRWTVQIEFAGGGERMQFVTEGPQWVPPADAWERIKERSLESEARVTIRGVDRLRPEVALCQGAVTVRTSKDEVAAPIFYREVNLPFGEAVKDPAAHIRWRFGSISSPHQPPIVLEKLPVCGNCHSFSADGSVLGMDVDYANDKGSYAMCSVCEEITLSEDKIITWADYRREDGKKTFGLLSQVSPDGRYVVSMVKDVSVFQAVDDLTFSQLFFPVRGILCVYDRQKETFSSLPGADDPQYVQSNPVWSPDGKYIVFARCEAYYAQEPRAGELGLTRAEEIAQFLSERDTFRFDLYRIPFNGGKGGTPEPLKGASHNGRSNYFPKYSPDGKWIVFCQANSFMLLQPDSELFIIPAQGGKARRLECNTSRMNSWHSWSPNSRWLVFSSKVFTPYTQLFLAHIDEKGHASPPVLLWQFTAPDMAANIPEFVNTSADAIRVIHSDFVEDLYHVRKADKYALSGQYDLAAEEFEKAVAINPQRATAHRLWGVMLLAQSKFAEAEQRVRKAIELQPDDRRAYWNLAKIMALTGRHGEAAETYRKAIQLDPYFASARLDFASLLLQLGEVDRALEQLEEAVQIEPDSPRPYLLLGDYYFQRGRLDKAAAAFTRVLEHDPQDVHALQRLATIMIRARNSQLYNQQQALALATKACELTEYQDPAVVIVLSEVFAAVGAKEDAISSATAALRMAEAAGDTELENTIRTKLEQFNKL